jgi:hypothetical protein
VWHNPYQPRLSCEALLTRLLLSHTFRSRSASKPIDSPAYGAPASSGTSRPRACFTRLSQLSPPKPAYGLSAPPRSCASWPGGGEQLVRVVARLELRALLREHAVLGRGYLRAEEVGLCQSSPAPPCAVTAPGKERATEPYGSAPLIPGSLHGLFFTRGRALRTHVPSNQSARLTAGMLVARNALCAACNRSCSGEWPWLSVHSAWATQICCGSCSSRCLPGDTGPGSGNRTLPADTTWLPCRTRPLRKHCTRLHGRGTYMWW